VIAAFIAAMLTGVRCTATMLVPTADRVPCVQDLPNGGWSAQLNTNRGGERAREFESSHVPSCRRRRRLTAFFEEVIQASTQGRDSGVVALGALRPTLLRCSMLRRVATHRPDECPFARSTRHRRRVVEQRHQDSRHRG